MSDWLVTLAWIVIAVDIVCAIAVTVDLMAGHAQSMRIMNLVWPITALYMGPLGVWAYVRLGRAKVKAIHGGEADPNHPDPSFWRSVFIGTTHCGAGCTLGDTVAEIGVFWLGVTLFGSRFFTNCLFDYILAFTAGIIFQYLAIVPMRKLSPAEGVVAAVKADALSLTAYEVGMFGWMALSRFVIFAGRPPEPDSPVYWVSMQLAMFAGFATSFPANWFLIAKGIKEKM